ncbi:MAG TPA: hypothetical protein VGE98_09625 [Thermoanaerobaculia bacterium]
MCRRNALRLVLLSVFVASTLAATPLLAAPAPSNAAPALPATTAATVPTESCGGSLLDTLDHLGAPNAKASSAPEAPSCSVKGDTTPQPSPRTSCIVGVTCTKHCACTCSQIKDCNVNSDCSNGRCFAGISCC